MNTQIQTLSFDTIPVLFNGDAFLNATAVAKHFNKVPKDYLKTEQTQEYIIALAECLSKGKKIPVEQNQLVIVKNGAPENGGGTWLHPKLAIHFARWLNPKFAVWCDEQIEHLLKNGQMPTVQPALPPSHKYALDVNEVLKLADLPLATYLHHLIRFYARAYGISQSSVDSLLADKFNYGKPMILFFNRLALLR